jgi:CRISPR-associated protein Csh2
MAHFNNRVFGCVIVKSINSNYNADFSGQPRTLPNGTVYATDKALKYAIKNYIKDIKGEKSLLYFKRLNAEFNPFDLPSAYKDIFNTEVKSDDKKAILKNILGKIDVKLFGATFAPKGEGIKDKNISIHGPVQINHGINIWKEHNIFSEQIMSPFANPNKKKNSEGEEEDNSASSLGRQSKLQEGHYLHHFSVNPKNLSEVVKLAGDESLTLQDENIDILKDSLRNGVTYYDSASKAGTDNEFLLWVKLNENSKTVLPNFTQLVGLDKDAAGKVVIDLEKVKSVIGNNLDQIEAVEIYYLSESVNVVNAPTDKTKCFDLTSGKAI